LVAGPGHGTVIYLFKIAQISQIVGPCATILVTVVVSKTTASYQKIFKTDESYKWLYSHGF
jgi:hypothetical protein